MVEEPARHRRLPADARRASLLDTTAALLTEGGFGAVTMDGVAARAGVSKALGYRYYDNADELLRALHERETSILAGRVQAAIAQAPTFEDVVSSSLTAWLDLLVERGSVVMILMQARPGAGPLQKQSRTSHAAASDFYGALAAREYAMSVRQATVVASCLLSGLDGLMACWENRRMPRRELIDVYTTLCLGAFQIVADRPPLIGDVGGAPPSRSRAPAGVVRPQANRTVQKAPKSRQ